MHEFDWGAEEAAEAFAGKDLRFLPTAITSPPFKN